MKLLIIGKARHGKDTVANGLAKRLGLTFKSSSMAALDIFLYDKLNELRRWSGLKPYQSKDEAFEDRVNHRELWFNLIAEYNALDKARLAKDIMQEADIYVGMRNMDEFVAARPIFDLVIWVDGERRLPDSESIESMNIPMTEAGWIIDNNGDEDQLREDLDLLELFIRDTLIAPAK